VLQSRSVSDPVQPLTDRPDNTPLAQLYAQLYPEIKRVARARLAQSGGIPGLNTTALVHEGFLRMADMQGLQGDSRGHFFAYVGQVLRSVVIDHLRGEQRQKRGGEQMMVTLSAAEQVADRGASAVDLIAVDDALRKMATLDPLLYQLLEMHGFAGLDVNELAALRGVSTRTIHRDLIKARALLQALLGEGLPSKP
jgi:RNA polymerase sigma factor (TIGR02999 family)